MKFINVSHLLLLNIIFSFLNLLAKDDHDANEALVKPKSIERFGPSALHCSNPFLLAEMKSRQERRVPMFHPPQVINCDLIVSYILTKNPLSD